MDRKEQGATVCGNYHPNIQEGVLSSIVPDIDCLVDSLLGMIAHVLINESIHVCRIVVIRGGRPGKTPLSSVECVIQASTILVSSLEGTESLIQPSIMDHRGCPCCLYVGILRVIVCSVPDHCS